MYCIKYEIVYHPYFCLYSLFKIFKSIIYTLSIRNQLGSWMYWVSVLPFCYNIRFFISTSIFLLCTFTFFQILSQYVTQSDVKHLILLPQFLKCWNRRHTLRFTPLKFLNNFTFCMFIIKFTNKCFNYFNFSK